MDLLPTGSDKVLEIHTSEVNIVIKAKKVWSGTYLEQSSSIAVAGVHLKKIHIPAVEVHGEYLESESAGDDKDGAEYAQYEITVSPLFFEQTDYEIIIKSVSGG